MPSASASRSPTSPSTARHRRPSTTRPGGALLGTRSPRRRLVLLVALSAALAGCALPEEAEEPTPTPTTGEGPEEMTEFEDLLLPPGVEGEVLASNLSFPTGVAWDSNGTMYVGEVGFTDAGPRILRVHENGTVEPLDLGPDVEGLLLDVTVVDDILYFTVGPRVHAMDLATGESRVLVDGLPSFGDHGTDEIIMGPDGRLYFGQGTVTNSGILGLDNADVALAISTVVSDMPDEHDVPCRDVTVTGVNYETSNPLAVDLDINANEGAALDAAFANYSSPDEVPTRDLDAERVVTGPYSRFGEATFEGETIAGETKCSGAVLSMNPDGSDLRVEAWGFRNPFALKFGDDGALWVSDNGYDHRGTRSAGATPDELYRIELGGGDGGEPTWFGWPDYSAGLPLTDPFFSPIWGLPVAKLLREDPNEPPDPWTVFAAHSSSNKFDFAPEDSAWAGDMFLAEFGTLDFELFRGAFAGMHVARVDVDDGSVHEFVFGQDRWSGEFRPVEAVFGPDGRLVVVDFGPWVNDEGDGNATHGMTYTPRLVPDEGRVLAFTLPTESDFVGRPVGGINRNNTDVVGGEMGDAPEGAEGVDVVEFGYAPSDLTVAPGTAVAFTNVGAEGHTVTAEDGSFHSGFELAPGNATFVWTPDEAGTYAYYCVLHPSMRGTVTVEEES